MLYDLVIVGGGPAAMSAGIYAARKKLKTLILAKTLGGQMMESYQVNNFLGLPEISGADLSKKFVSHLKSFTATTTGGAFDLEIKEGDDVKNIKPIVVVDRNIFEVHVSKNIYQAKTVIIATGKTERKLDVKGAAEFEGKGISYCATCDAPIFRDKIVAVIGGGDAGQDTAWQLLGYASKIYILSRYADLKGNNKELLNNLKKNDKIEIFYETEPKEIFGQKFVEGLVCLNLKTKEEKTIKVSGIFVEIGSAPSSLFVDGLLRRNEKGEIVIDHNSGATSVPGIFAAGDVTDKKGKQIIIAAGEGAQAALSAYEYLKTHNT